MIDVPYDGNCFYSALTVVLRKDLSYYKTLKSKIADYHLAHSEKYKEFNIPKELAVEIRKEGRYASFDAMRVAADYL